MRKSGDNDMRQVREMASSGDEGARQRAREALAIYVNRIVKYIGAYTAEMGGVDVITFTAGIGENDVALRREVCERLRPLGIRIDKHANNQRVRKPLTISKKGSSARIMVVPTNEELAIAEQVASVV